MKTLFSRPLRLSTVQVRIVKLAFHLIAMGYVSLAFYQGINDALGADPVETLIHSTGIAAVNLLIFTLCLSPMARHLPCGDLMRLRRLAGLYTFFYACCHFLSYVAFELQFNLSLVADEIVKRPYITVGFCALLILTALAITSFNRLRKRMGRRWQKLHNWVYLAMLLALLHYTWSLKTAWQEPVFYWAGAALLLYLRRDKLLRLGRRSSIGKSAAQRRTL